MTGAYQLHRRVNLIEQFAYASGDAGFNLLWVLFDSFLLFFLVEVAHLSRAQVAVIVLLSRCADVAAGIAFALFGDRVHTGLGTFRPSLLAVALPLPAAFSLLFFLPSHANGLSHLTTVVWTALLAAMFAALYSVGNAAYTALLAVLTPQDTDRVRISSLRFAFAAIGVLAVQYFALPVAHRLGPARGWAVTAATCAAGCALALLVVICGTQERLSTAASSAVEFTQVVRDAFGARQLLWLVLAMVAGLAALSCRGAASPFYLQSAVHDANRIGLTLVANPLAAFAACAFFPLTVPQRWLAPGLLASLCAAAGAVLCLAPIFWSRPTPVALIVLQAGFGLTTGLFVPALFVLFASSGKERPETLKPALLASITLLALKAGSAAGALISSAAVSVTNTAGLAAPHMRGYQSLFTVWPAVLFGVTLISLLASRRGDSHPTRAEK